MNPHFKRCHRKGKIKVFQDMTGIMLFADKIGRRLKFEVVTSIFFCSRGCDGIYPIRLNTGYGEIPYPIEIF